MLRGVLSKKNTAHQETRIIEKLAIKQCRFNIRVKKSILFIPSFQYFNNKFKEKLKKLSKTACQSKENP